MKGRVLIKEQSGEDSYGNMSQSSMRKAKKMLESSNVQTKGRSEAKKSECHGSSRYEKYSQRSIQSGS